MVLDKLIIRDRKLAARKRDAEMLAELRKPQEDSEIVNHKEFPTLERLPGLKLTGKALADLLMVFEFLHNFGETLGFGKHFMLHITHSTFPYSKHTKTIFSMQIWNHYRHYKVYIKH